MTEPRDFDEAVQMVHRAFCDPKHELVGEWDREMADALRRNGYEIRLATEPSVAEAEGIIQRGHVPCCWCGEHHEEGR